MLFTSERSLLLQKSCSPQLRQEAKDQQHTSNRPQKLIPSLHVLSFPNYPWRNFVHIELKQGQPDCSGICLTTFSTAFFGRCRHSFLLPLSLLRRPLESAGVDLIRKKSRKKVPRKKRKLGRKKDHRSEGKL